MHCDPIYESKYLSTNVQNGPESGCPLCTVLSEPTCLAGLDRCVLKRLHGRSWLHHGKPDASDELGYALCAVTSGTMPMLAYSNGSILDCLLAWSNWV